MRGFGAWLIAIVLVLGGCGDRGGDDWIGIWSGGDPADDDDITGDDDDDITGDDDDTTPADDDDTTEGDDDDTTPADADGDGYDETVDCDDTDAALNLDDADHDGWTTCDDDCDDNDDDIYPGAEELCDGDLNDCDGTLPVDEVDDDGDGHLACAECDDADAASYPGAEELCDGVDNDCDGTVPADEIDGDLDGLSACEGDCDDTDVSLNRLDADEDSWDTCDGDCDDNDSSLHPADVDLDGVSPCDGDCDDGDAALNTDDADGDGWSTCDGDCDDGDADTHPGDGDGDGASSCDGDCDDTDPALNLGDLDGDTHHTCGGDCDDGDATIYPGAPELCDGLLNDCDGTLPPDEADGDGDGDLGCADCDDADPWLDLSDDDGDGYSTCAGDCDDTDAGLNPADADADGVASCDGDCDDADDQSYPLAPELCGYGVDNDCDGVVDEDCTCPLYVDGSGVGGSQPGDWYHPYQSVADAVIGLQPGCDEVHVLAGTYTDLLHVSGRDLVLIALDGPAVTSLERAGFDQVLRFENGDLQLDGFTLSDGMWVDGGGLHLGGATARITGCVFEDNACGMYGNGGGIYVDGGSLELVDSVVRGNDCYSGYGDNGADGGGLWALDAELTIDGCEFTDNAAGDGGGIYLENCVAEITHSVIAGNLATDTEPLSGDLRGGGGLAVRGGLVSLTNILVFENETSGHGGGVLSLETLQSLVVVNSTIAANASSYGGGGVHAAAGGGLLLTNSIVAFDSVAGGVAEIDADDPGDQPTVTYCDVHGDGDPYGPLLTDRTGQSGNLSVDPLLMSLAVDGVYDDDLRLGVGSPCQDAGNPFVDYDDPDGSRNDMGAYGGPAGSWP